MRTLAILLVGLVAGLSEGFSGAGWGVFSLAMLVTLGVNPLVAVSSSILVELVLGVVNNCAHFNLGAFDWRIALPLLLSGVIGILIGSRYSNHIPERGFQFVLGCVIVFFGFVIIKKVI